MTIRLPAANFVIVFLCRNYPKCRYFASKTPWAVQIAPPLFCRMPFTPSLWFFGQFLLLSELRGLRRFLTKSRYLLAVYCVVVQAGQDFSPSLRRFLSVVDLLRYFVRRGAGQACPSSCSSCPCDFKLFPHSFYHSLAVRTR